MGEKPLQLKIPTKSKEKIRTLGTFSHNDKVYLYFQLSSDSSIHFHVATSTDGFSFERVKDECIIEKGKVTKEEITLCSDFTISEHGGYFLLLYLRKGNNKPVLEKAWSKDLLSWQYEGNMISLYQKGIIVSNYLHKGKSILYSSDASLFVYFSKDLIHWEKEEKELLTPWDTFFGSGTLAIESAINSEKGILLIYHAKVNDVYFVGIALFDRDDPTHLLWRTSEPLWTTPQEWKKKAIPVF